MHGFLKFWQAWWVGITMLFAFPPAVLAAGQAGAQVKVVYQVSEGTDQAARALHNIRNQLDTDPGAKIVVVALGAGVDFLLDGATDKNGNPFDVTVQTLIARGVQFRVCNNTLMSRGISKDQVIPEAKLIASGMAEIARLQSREGYGYVKP